MAKATVTDLLKLLMVWFAEYAVPVKFYYHKFGNEWHLELGIDFYDNCKLHYTGKEPLELLTKAVLDLAERRGYGIHGND